MKTIAQLVVDYAFFGYTKAQAVKRIVEGRIASGNLRETKGSLRGKVTAALLRRQTSRA